MGKWQRYVGAAIAVGVLVGVVSLSSTGSALAQSPLKPLMTLIVNGDDSPVPVRVIGEPARRPYAVDDVGTCNNSNCFFEFPAVPEGMRLEILHVSGIARPSAATTIIDMAQLVTDDTEHSHLARNTIAVELIGRSGVNVAADTYGFNQPVLAHVRAGNVPRLVMSTRDGGAVFFSQATISGYLVEVP
jgi:hypothetical protein